MATLDTFLSLSLQSTVSDTGGFGPPKLRSIFPFTQATLADGDASVLGIKEVTVPAGGDITVDLATGLTDPRGVPVTLTEAIIFAVYNANEEVGATVEMGNAASNAWTGWISSATATKDLEAGGVHLDYAPDGMSIVPSVTGNNLKFYNLATNVDVTVWLMVVGN